MRLLCPAVVGRLSEMDTLARGLTAAAGGTGTTVFLTAAAGLGKTRLTREAQTLATRSGMLVLRGRAAPSVQYRPLTEALLGVLRRDRSPEPAQLGPYRAALSRLVPGWAGTPWPDGADDHPILLAEAVLRLLNGLAADRGALLVLEDLHDADADTLMIIDYLVDNIAHEPIMLLATMRPGAAVLPLSYAAEQRHSAVVLRMPPLDEAAVREMSGACLGVPPAAVPAAALDRVVRSSGGVPFFVEELLTGMVEDGMLVRDGARWSAAAAAAAQVPAAVRASVVTRTERLDPAGHRLLLMAAVCEQPCPGPLLGAAAGLGPAELVAGLRAAVEAQLLVVDAPTGRYVVQHALVGEALRAATLPEDLAALSRAAATAIEEHFAGLPDEWCVLAGRLWQQAGETGRAAELFYRAGRRAAGQGAVRTAIGLLERGLTLLAGAAAAGARTAKLVEALLEMLVAAGEVTRAREFAAQLDRHATREEQAAVHLRLARAAVTAGQWDAGRRELSRVRVLTEHGRSAGQEAAISVVAARLAVAESDPGRLQRAEVLATRALRTAERLPLPEIACEALAVLGSCARVHDLERSDELFFRALTLAEQHGLTLWRIRFLYQLGTNGAIRRADPGGLLAAREAALQAGAVTTALDGAAELAVLHICRGEYHTAADYAEQCEQAAHRLGLEDLRLIALGLRSCVAAHRGRRAETGKLLAEYDRLGGRQIDFTSALKGFGLAVCALLEEDRAGAHALVCEAAAEEAHRPPEYLSLVHGLHLLMTVLASEAGWPEHDRIARSARGQAGWNRVFLLAAGAALAGRSGDPARAAALMLEFDQVAGAYPLARHLALRLVAEAAVTDGWGRPAPWLRAAEQHFHATGMTRVADACRALLRRAGESVPQRRRGAEAIPPELRGVGVTVREYEVLELIADRLTNQEIGRRLFVSPRTVETHVTRLLAKTGLPDRTALARHARALPADRGAS
ncbi:AAA family ATPase [Actinoplanes sp. N902-109]|uniref:ATP-binding protein n=1 Tax=Actinoplanes sp. (strain N902-109) TaxID=649831 RepID=UPI0003295578|nr:LuxR family transcriptional regulator [Actinoplanes sp. N902-109]AGL19071.1 LuxR family transcriptional regulator [Actinoplanes sp. N902-109]